MNKLYHKMQNIFAQNREISRKLSGPLPTRKKDPFRDYEETVIQIIKQNKNPLVLDIGGGRQCFLGSSNISDKRIICLDIQINQLDANCDVDYLIQGNALNIPLANNSVDIIISRSFIEHLPSVETFFQEANRVLKKGGYLISVFPCKFAIFAIINQLLPDFLSKKALKHFVLSEEEIGFRAYYNKCYFSGIKLLLKRNHYKIIGINDYHFSSPYFEFLFPLFLLSCLYEICTQSIKNLASYLLIIAQKPT